MAEDKDGLLITTPVAMYSEGMWYRKGKRCYYQVMRGNQDNIPTVGTPIWDTLRILDMNRNLYSVEIAEWQDKVKL